MSTARELIEATLDEKVVKGKVSITNMEFSDLARVKIGGKDFAASLVTGYTAAEFNDERGLEVPSKQWAALQKVLNGIMITIDASGSLLVKAVK